MPSNGELRARAFRGIDPINRGASVVLEDSTRRVAGVEVGRSPQRWEAALPAVGPLSPAACPGAAPSRPPLTGGRTDGNAALSRSPRLAF
jgi:hypothetical protein